jgi:hypothetical protein
MMCPAIDNPTSCKICTLICLLNAKNVSAVEIPCELCEVYRQSVMSKGTIRQWCRMFKGGQANVHDEERSGQPAICSE